MTVAASAVSRVDARQDLASRLVAGDLREIQATFSEKGATGPRLVWAPTIDDLRPVQLHFLLHHWNALKGTQPYPRGAQIDPLQLQPALGFIALVDVVDRGADFRYRLFGSKIAYVSGFDVTGRLVSQHPASPYIVEFSLAAYRAVLRRGEPMATVHSPPPAVSTTVWHRLILPLAGEGGAIERFLVGIVPMARDGRPVS
jgi:hypothetical protein